MAKNAKYFLVIFLALLFLPLSTAKAVNPIVTEPTDYWFEYAEPTTFIAQTYMVSGYNSDPMLWLYNEAGTVLASNDDYFGLQSYISREVPAGRYRLRAGICCGDPNAWRTNGGWNLQYELSFNGEPVNTTSTSTTSTSTTTSTTTTTTTTTTSTLPPTTTSTSTTTTTSTLPPTTTTTVPPTTTSSTTITTSTTSTSSTTTSTTEAPTTTTLPPTTTTSTSTSTTSMVVQEPVQVTSTTSTSTTILPATTTTIPVIPPTITAAEATVVATNPEALATITAKEATQVFQALELDTLTEDQLVELVAAVQDAPTEVRAAFEEEIDIFSGSTDTYVPIGSTVPVKTRRALIAIGVVMSSAPALKRRK